MADDPDVRDVIDRELRLHDPAVRAAPEMANDLLDLEFHEFGASGRVWDRAATLDMMAGDETPAPATNDLIATRLAEDVILLTYRTRSTARTALRSSIWRRQGDGPWRIYFHQGTVIPPAS